MPRGRGTIARPLNRPWLPPEPDRVQVALAYLVDPREQLVEVVVLGVQVAAGERVVATGCELADELRRQLRRRPGRVLPEHTHALGHFRPHEARAEEEDGDSARELIRERLAVAADRRLARRIGGAVAARQVRCAAGR